VDEHGRVAREQRRVVSRARLRRARERQDEREAYMTDSA